MGFFEGLWKTFRFASSATVGIPIACSMSAFIGALYLAAEATNIVETNVKNSVKGNLQIHRKPFFQAIADGLGTAFGKTWSDFGAYAPLTALGTVQTAIRSKNAHDSRSLVSSIIEDLDITPEEKLKLIEEHSKHDVDHFKKAVKEEFPDKIKQLSEEKKKSVDKTLEESLKEAEPNRTTQPKENKPLAPGVVAETGTGGVSLTA